jgi:hypothetical protein
MGFGIRRGWPGPLDLVFSPDRIGEDHVGGGFFT